MHEISYNFIKYIFMSCLMIFFLEIQKDKRLLDFNKISKKLFLLLFIL